jgi:hypothetical protein
MGRLDEKHALIGEDVAAVIADLQQEFPTAAQVNSGGN